MHVQVSKSLSKLLKLFLENRIDFCVVGGFAGVVYGSSLVTHDLDLCISLSNKNVEKLREVLKPYHPVHRQTPQKLSFLEFPSNISDLKNLYLSTDLGVVDLLTDITGVGNYERVAEKANQIELFGYPCKVISIEDLIKSKKTLGREKDLIAVKELEVILKK